MCKGSLTLKGVYEIVCKDKDGKLKWEDTIPNLILDAWLNQLLDIIYNNGAQPANYYMGLVSGPAPVFAPTDTALAHPGWTNFLLYDEASRPEWNPGASAGQEVENPAPLTFTINGNGSVAGLFIISDNSVLNDFLTGTLVSEVVFAQGVKNVADGDTLEVTYKQSAASA